MATLHTPANAVYLAQVSVEAFLAILFLQSGIDKILDRKGNLGWLTGHFAKSPLAGMVPLLLLIITMMELAAGLLSAAGVVQLLLNRETTLAFWGAAASTLSIICLFLGQRLAKDYAGAGALVPYFILSNFALILLGALPKP